MRGGMGAVRRGVVMGMLGAIGTLGAMGTFAGSAGAHEFRPGLLDVTAFGGGRFDLGRKQIVIAPGE